MHITQQLSKYNLMTKFVKYILYNNFTSVSRWHSYEHNY